MPTSAQQHVNAPIAVANACLCDLPHPRAQPNPRILAAGVVLDAAMLPDQAAGPSLTDLVALHEVVHHLASQRGPGHFF